LRYYFCPGIKSHSDVLNKPLISSIPSPALYPSEPISKTAIPEVSENHKDDPIIIIEKSVVHSFRSTSSPSSDHLNSLKYSYAESDSETSEKDRTLTETEYNLKYSYAESDSETSEKDRNMTETEEEVFQFVHIPGSSYSNHLQTEVDILDTELNQISPASFTQDNVEIRHHAVSHQIEHAELKPVGINQQNIWKPNQNNDSKKRLSDARQSFTAGILNDSNANISSSENVKEQLLKSSFDPRPVNELSTHSIAQFPTYSFPSPYCYDSSPQFVQEVRVF